MYRDLLVKKFADKQYRKLYVVQKRFSRREKIGETNLRYLSYDKLVKSSCEVER